MRRNRQRSATIDAESIDEYLNYEKSKSRLSQIIFKNKEIKEIIKEEEEENLDSQRTSKLSFHLNNLENDDDDESDLGAYNN